VVERRQLIQRLAAAKVSRRDVDLAAIVSEEKAERAQAASAENARTKARALIAKVLEGFPENLTEAKLVGEPTRTRMDGGKVGIGLTVRLQINLDAYNSFTSRLVQVLDQVALRKGEVTVVSTFDEQCFKVPERIDPEPELSLSNEQCLVMVNTTRTKALDRTQWRYYVTDGARDLFQPCLRATFAINVRLLEGKGDLIANDSFPALLPTTVPLVPLAVAAPKFTPRTVRFGQRFKHNDYRPPFSEMPILISPMFFFIQERRRGSAEIRETLAYIPYFNLARTIPLTLEEIEQVKQVRCELAAKERR
jgi:hypothetical protein